MSEDGDVRRLVKFAPPAHAWRFMGTYNPNDE